MRKLKPYKPTPQDIAFANQQVRLLRSGGVMAAKHGSYMFDHTAKTMTLVLPPDPWDNPMTLLMHHRTDCVFSEVGYTILPKVEWDKIELPDEQPGWTKGWVDQLARENGIEIPEEDK